MLQVEWLQEAGFFTYSHQTMDLEALKEVIEKKAGIEVGLRCKTIYQGKQAELTKNTSVVQAIHIELDTKGFNKNF